MKECTNDEGGVRGVGGQRRKWSEWWSEIVGVVVDEEVGVVVDEEVGVVILMNCYREEIGLCCETDT